MGSDSDGVPDRVFENKHLVLCSPTHTFQPGKTINASLGVLSMMYEHFKIQRVFISK